MVKRGIVPAHEEKLAYKRGNCLGLRKKLAYEESWPTKGAIVLSYERGKCFGLRRKAGLQMGQMPSPTKKSWSKKGAIALAYQKKLAYGKGNCLGLRRKSDLRKGLLPRSMEKNGLRKRSTKNTSARDRLGLPRKIWATIYVEAMYESYFCDQVEKGLGRRKR